MQREYGQALEVAIGAARVAGAVLRAEFHRPGGPRGAPGHAPVDEEAEREIRGRLLGAFPTWGYLGEETGASTASSGEDHVWLVDPNDGTISFQKGYRGSAVSIGLLRAGEPVVGVVFAFAAPDDDGDLIAWAEGCGSIQRNGRAIQRNGWHREIGADTIVLLARGGDARPTANAAAVAPGRFRAIPSIAYRLALAAVGEGEAAVSLHSPGAWDYGGGHALLRGTGGVLVDERARAVGYSPDGRSRTGYCFGGAPGVVESLVERDWPTVLSGPRACGDVYEPERPRPGETVEEASVLSRAHGCLLGQLAGDALGGQVEFQTPDQIRREHPGGLRAMAASAVWRTLAGQPTDDSELALALARSIVRATGYDAESAALAYRYWYHSHPFDCGTTTATALGAIGEADVAGGNAAGAAARAAIQTSQANGSMMRVSPLGVWGHRLDPSELAALAEADSTLTHPSAVCRAASVTLAVAVARAVATGDGPSEIYQFTRQWAEAGGIVEPAVLGALRGGRFRSPWRLSLAPGLGAHHPAECLLPASPRADRRGGDCRHDRGRGRHGHQRRGRRCPGWGRARPRRHPAGVASGGAELSARSGRSRRAAPSAARLLADRRPGARRTPRLAGPASPSDPAPIPIPHP